MREDSQIDFAVGNGFLHVWRGLHKKVSQMLAVIDFFKQRNYQENVVSKEEILQIT